MSTLEQARATVLLYEFMFRHDFFEWLTLNFSINLEFEREADKGRALGRESYGHRTIWEHIRHETTLREVNSDFKMNDHYTKGCAVLYMMLHPQAKQFFRFRESVNVEQIARAA